MIKDAEKIYSGAIKASLPDETVISALKDFRLPEGKLILVAIGKAAWKMANAAYGVLGGAVNSGIVITKYEHSEGKIGNLEIYEAAHPVPDENGIRATERALRVTENLTERDTVLFLVSGGGSALFECPCITLSELSDLTKKLLGSGADINEMNAVRKHISAVKGGRFADHIAPAKIFAIALSDVLGNRLDIIASGPCASDVSTSDEVLDILKKYNISLPDRAVEYIKKETPKEVKNATHVIGGSVSELCREAKKIAEELGYKAEILSDEETGEARELGIRLAKIARENSQTKIPLAFIVGGETVVKLRGEGLGGRNQETALAAAEGIRGLGDVLIFSVGSDGTDGPTDAAGGYVTGDSFDKMLSIGVNPIAALENNDSYHALGKIGNLIITGPTGTNVNDVAVLLIK